MSIPRRPTRQVKDAQITLADYAKGSSASPSNGAYLTPYRHRYAALTDDEVRAILEGGADDGPN